MYAVQNEHSALDIVQDAMVKLSEKYGDKPADELPMLFQRILQNTIRDYYRRQNTRNHWFSLFSSFSKKETDDRSEQDFDLLETVSDQDYTEQSISSIPDERLQQSQTMELVELALTNLPARQREAFLLRYWEGMDTSETASIMGCSEGSVKTHCSRAIQSLAAFLDQKGVKLP